MEEVKFILGTGKPRIAEVAFLFHGSRILHGPVVGEQSLLKTYQGHKGKLQSFAGMKSHQHHLDPF